MHVRRHFLHLMLCAADAETEAEAEVDVEVEVEKTDSAYRCVIRFGCRKQVGVWHRMKRSSAKLGARCSALPVQVVFWYAAVPHLQNVQFVA